MDTRTRMRQMVLLVTFLLAACGKDSPGGPAVSGAISTSRFLTSGSLDYWPCFSPDGNSVLFSRRVDGSAPWSLWIVATAGGEPRPLMRAALAVSATRANWSSQNRLIAFTGTSADGKSTVWIVDSDGSNPHPVAATGLSDQVVYPSWYPDGKQLAVMDAHDQVIKRIDLNGGAAVTLTRHDQVLTGMASVSPDGKWIAFAGQANVGQQYDQTRNSIWLLSGATGMLRELEEPPQQGRAPTWAPDGERLAFESDRGSWGRSYTVFIISRDGTRPRQVTGYELNATHPVWSPDGRRLVFASAPDWPQASRIAIVDLPSKQ
jgi:Tol biopolymer transport system component